MFWSANRKPILKIGDAQSGVDLAQAFHRLPRFFHPPRQPMACGHNGGRGHVIRILPKSLFRPCRRVVEPTGEQMCEARANLHMIQARIEGTKAHSAGQVLDRDVCLAAISSYPATEIPPRRQVWIEQVRPIEEGGAAIEVTDEKAKCMSAPRKSDCIVPA